MNIRAFATAIVLATAAVLPSFAQTPAPVPANNATLMGTIGPNSNSSGYPSAGSPGGTIATTTVGPQTTARGPAAPGAAVPE